MRGLWTLQDKPQLIAQLGVWRSRLATGIESSKRQFGLFMLFLLLNLAKICQQCFIFNLLGTTCHPRQL